MRRLFLTTVFLAFVIALFGQVAESLPRTFGTISAEERDDLYSADPVQIQDRGVDGVTIRYVPEDLSVRSEVIDGKKWDRIRIPGYPMSQDVGLPQLPARSEVIMVPEGATFDFSFTHSAPVIQPGFRVYPTLEPATDRYGDPEPEFAFDTLAYQTDAFWPPAPVRKVTVQALRGMQVIWFDIMPVAFNPVTGELKVYDELTLEVNFQGATQFMDYTLHSESWLRNFPLVGANAASLADEIHEQLQAAFQPEGTSSQPVGGYIILTDSLFIDASEKLADWKRQLGYRVDLVAGTNWTFPDMRDSVKVRYDNWVPKPDYLLIVGDHDRLPAQMLLNPDNILFGSDLHLVTLGQQVFGHLPDMARGRLSVVSPAQAMTVVNKIINYERTPPADSSFYLTGLNAAQFQDDDFDYHCDRRFVHTSEEIRDYLLSQGYQVNRVYYADTVNSTPLFYNQSYYSNGQSLPADLLSPSFNWKGNATHIRNHINNGAFYVLHRDHGYAGGTGWHAPHYVSSHVSQLTNGNKTPIVFSINCHTGEFTLPECFAERFQRHPNGGAVGVVAASYYSYSGWNDGLSIGMFDAIWSQPGLLPAFGAGGIFSPVITPHQDIRNMGFVMNHGLLRMTQTWSSALGPAQYQYRLYHYFGDPSMRIRTAPPTQIVAQHPDTIVCGTASIQITAVNYPNAVATLTLPGEKVGVTTLVNGAGTLSIKPFSSPYLLLTISGPEHVAYIDTVFITTSPLNVIHHVEPVKCYGSSDGSIRLELACGEAPFVVNWAHGPNQQNLHQLPAGTYHYTVTDATNTVVSDSIVLINPPSPIQVQADVTDVKCYYGKNGAIELTKQGGVPPYTLRWSNGRETALIDNLSAGNFTVTLTDSLGCVYVDSFIVTQPMPLQIADQVAHDAGNCTGSATALPTGGTPPYSYLWNDPDGQTTQTAAGLCYGTYRVWVTDSNECVTVRNFTIHNISGLETMPQEDALLFFPNPLDRSELTIQLPSDLPPAEYRVTVLNAIGQEAYQGLHTPEGGIIQLNPYPVRRGVSFVIVSNESKGILLRGKVVGI